MRDRTVIVTTAIGLGITIPMVWLTLSNPAVGIVLVIVFLGALWAWQNPVAAASTLAFLTAAFPKAGLRIGDFPVPIFLFGLSAAVLIMFVRSARVPHPPLTLVLVGAYLALVAGRALVFSQQGFADVFALVAWAAFPLLLLCLSTSMKDVDPKFTRAFQWGFLFSVLYAVIQVIGGLEETAIPGLTQALGDDITEKHNTIYVTGGTDYSKIPSTYHNGNIYGIAAAFFLCYSLIRLQRHVGTKLDIATLCGATIAIGLSGSRTAIVAAGATVLILLFSRGSMRWRLGIVALAAVAATIVLMVEPELATRYTVDAIIRSGGSGRLTTWTQALSDLSITEILFGGPTRTALPDGWVGMIIQLGIVGTLLLVVAVIALMRHRREWLPVLLVFLVAAIIDATYLTFPTWFLPAAMVAGRLRERPVKKVPHASTRRAQKSSSESVVAA